MAMKLLDGSEAIAEAAVIAGLRFYAAYPMSPSTELLEHLARKLPQQKGGVCINVESEIEGVNMAMGAAAAGFRAATGSCGQGLALMQEAIAESALNETPLVVFNMARNQQDYFQATRGGGWGDYRTITLAPNPVPRGGNVTLAALGSNALRLSGFTLIAADGRIIRSERSPRMVIDRMVLSTHDLDAGVYHVVLNGPTGAPAARGRLVVQ